MTSYILSQLRTLPSAGDRAQHSTSGTTTTPSPTHNPSSSTIASTRSVPTLQLLVPEVLAQISSFLHIQDIFSLRLSCKVLPFCLPLDQLFWRQQLTSGTLFGLRDFDRSLLRNGHHELNGMDWKRLVRTLARYESFEGGESGKSRGEWGEMHDAPLGLKNRRRIWKVITGVEMTSALQLIRRRAGKSCSTHTHLEVSILSCETSKANSNER